MWRTKYKRSILLILFFIVLQPMTAYACNETYISQIARNACVKYGDEYAICPEWLMSIAENESSGRPDAENGNCKGIMQVDAIVHKERMERLGCTDLFDEDQNIHVAADYLAELFQEYEDAYSVLMCYNVGPAGAQKLFDRNIYESDYAVEICKRAEELERLHGK